MGVNFDIVPTHLVVKAMQDSGYRNAAYALAELMDNAAQAEATRIELLCVEAEGLVNKRNRARLDQVAVLDNGQGMDAETLRGALQFGNGSHLEDRSGIGRFGMGLPNSSLSQGSRVDVWTWQNGSKNALYSYLDVHEIAQGDLKVVPEPVLKAIPSVWIKVGKCFEESGTLVVWPRPDRCTWKTARGVVKNSEEIIGRIYRRFIDDDRITIRLAAFLDTALDDPTIDDLALPNDPLYLMARTSCAEPFSEKPMFEPWGPDNKHDIMIRFKGESHKVTITYSIALKEARAGHDRGGDPHGKHAGRNLGVSVMRADRELELDPRWMPSYDPTARWVGVEIMFPPALDEIFGVTNNKQSATHLADIAGTDKSELASRHGYPTYQALKSAWSEDNDMRGPLLDIKDNVDSAIRAMMKLLKAQTKGSRGTRRFDPDSPESKATEATRKRAKAGHAGTSDTGEAERPEARKQKLRKGLEEAGVPEKDAEQLAAKTVDRGLKYVFTHTDSAGGAFFSVRPKGGALVVTLNTSHPAYDNLVGLLEDPIADDSLDVLRDKHDRALAGLKLLLTAWARYEDEVPDGPKKDAAADAREDWGRVAREFLSGA